MQLSKIKIAGFKSFVDPTTISLPSKLLAIVGPNGCGKSNIIDAVTWVMGESSPKYLRGEALTDVIFNGSSARKPVGQASVELIFDNSDGTLGGEYANFSEVSIKRQINRESDSTYFLNGVRCRKRDVVDLFLGTGLGPRSYSIIGQNMISRIIEAKPDELRTYIEEAAGISKYKERRHETELRIQHTKENLARVNDVCAELEKQLNHLKHQANVAEKFKHLKQQERELRAQLYGIQWRHLDSMMVDHTLRIQHEETALEARQSELLTTDREIEEMRNEQRAAQDGFQEVQRRYYAVGNEITRIEQDILHHQERQRQWEQDLRQAEKDYESLQEQKNEMEQELQELEYENQQLEPKLQLLTEQVDSQDEALQAAEENMQAWQSSWDEFNSASAKTTQIAQVEKTQIQHLEQRIASLQKRLTQIEQDANRFNFTDLNTEITSITHQAETANEQLETFTEQLAEIREMIQSEQNKQQDETIKLDHIRSELQRLRGQQASLEALQQTALGQRDNPASSFVKTHNLATNPRLAQQINVEKGWEFAVEKVLGFCLQAICIDDVNTVLPHLDDLQKSNLCVFVPPKAQSLADKSIKAFLLIEKIKSDWPLDSLLADIYTADSLDDALKLCESLDANQSVVTRDGIWLNRSWLKILRQEDPAAGVFEREQELKSLALRIEELETQQEELEKFISIRKDKLHELDEQREQLQKNYNQQQAQHAQLNAQQKMKRERLTELTNQIERFNKEKTECQSELLQAENALIQAKKNWQEALSELETSAAKRDQLVAERERVRQALQNVREQSNQKKDEMHELEIRSQTIKSQKSSLQQNIIRLGNQSISLNERKTTIEKELTSMSSIDGIKKTLSEALDKHVAIESELNSARILVQSLEQEFRNLENKRQAIERDSNKVRGSLEILRVEYQGWRVKADSILEQFKETEYKLEDILRELPVNILAEEWQAKLDQVVQRVNRLGPINLVAIEEYATCLERKEYLDKQLADLQAGLATLEDAIAKIDRETKARFKETFDKVNDRFQELFPTVFGGGKAYLELNSDDLLEAGITMMACPPGKRNSSIYLLSGGEKSLTAIALIFSIFHLNPAPFCLLDEVDAALDDANVLRFTRLVKVMANKTQFLFISHNKITIEMGEHLIGVTMNEPGVSRLVSVDIEKAISLAGS